MRSAAILTFAFWWLANISNGQDVKDQNGPAATGYPGAYVLSPDDQIEITAPESELGAKPVRIDVDGYIRLRHIRRIRAGDLTTEQLRAEITTRLKFIHEPEVSVAVVQYRSQPVSVIGAVKSP